MIVDQVGYTVQEWTDFVNYALSHFGPIQKLEDEGDWKEWAANVFLIPTIADQHPPDPYMYDDWRKWADDFNLAVTLQ